MTAEMKLWWAVHWPKLKDYFEVLGDAGWDWLDWADWARAQKN